MGKMKERLLEIDEELREIEAIPYAQCSPDQIARHEALCQARWKLEPPAGLGFVPVRKCN